MGWHVYREKRNAVLDEAITKFWTTTNDSIGAQYTYVPDSLPPDDPSPSKLCTLPPFGPPFVAICSHDTFTLKRPTPRFFFLPTTYLMQGRCGSSSLSHHGYALFHLQRRFDRQRVFGLPWSFSLLSRQKLMFTPPVCSTPRDH
jgi:hypothetical protein